jgi:hypothetical protein
VRGDCRRVGGQLKVWRGQGQLCLVRMQLNPKRALAHSLSLSPLTLSLWLTLSLARARSSFQRRVRRARLGPAVYFGA